MGCHLYVRVYIPRQQDQGLTDKPFVLARRWGSSCMPLRALQNFHRKELEDKQRVTLNAAFSLTPERPFLPILLDQNRCKSIIDD